MDIFDQLGHTADKCTPECEHLEPIYTPPQTAEGLKQMSDEIEKTFRAVCGD